MASAKEETGVNIELVIEKLSTNGTEQLDRSYVKQLKAYCKSLSSNQGEGYNYLGRLVLHQLEKHHAQIRYGSLLIIEYLFERSHQFRLFICDNLNAFFELCIDIKGFRYATTFDDHFEVEDEEDAANINRRSKSKKSLQPIVWAKRLRAKALECFQYWHREFGKGYSTLKNGYRFLQSKCAIESSRNYGAGSASTFTRPIQSQTAHSDQSFIQQFQLDSISKKFEEIENDAKLLITQIDTCFDLLIPKFQVIEKAEGDQSSDFYFRPMQGLSFSIILNAKVEISRDSGNSDLIDNLSEFCEELNQISTEKLSELDDTLCKLKLPLFADKVTEMARKVKCLCIQIGTIVWKFNEINIINASNSTYNKRKTSTDLSLNDADNDESDIDDEDDDEFEDVQEREDVFLLKKIEVEKEKQTKEIEPSASSSSLATHTLPGSPTGETRCRAALPSGRLCPRRDKVKCPFHGTLIPRDDQGLPLDSLLRQHELEARFQQKADEWKDPKYLRQLSIQTGYDLEGRNLKNRRKKYPNLIDIKKLKNTPRKRLMRKIGSKRMRDKVSKDLSALDDQAHRQYSEQFNYSLEN